MMHAGAPYSEGQQEREDDVMRQKVDTRPEMCWKEAQIHPEIHELYSVSAYRVRMSHATSETGWR